MIKSGMGNIALAYIKATVVLAHSQGRLRSLAGRACMGHNPSKQSKYSNRAVTEMVYKRSAFVKSICGGSVLVYTSS